MTQRIKFFLIHLSISIVIALIISIIIFFVWYPYPIAQAVGVIKLFIMLVVIDVIIGPLMTLLIYKKNLSDFKMDLIIIIAIQLIAFIYGFYTVAQGRPVWIVFNQNKFELVRMNDQFIENYEKIPDQFQNISWTGAQYVAALPSQNVKQKEDDLFMEALGGISLAQRPERYVKISTVIQEIQKKSINLKELNQYNNKDKVKKLLAQYPQASGYLPLKANYLDMVILINKEGKIINIINLRPWKE